MELNEILAKMAEPEKLIEPNDIALLSQHITGFITDYELAYDEAKLAYSFRWEEVKYKVPEGEKPLTDKLTEIRMMHDPVTAHLYKTKRTLSELKRYKRDLDRRLEIMLGQRRRM
jgi:hypothetical protein